MERGKNMKISKEEKKKFDDHLAKRDVDAIYRYAKKRSKELQDRIK